MTPPQEAPDAGLAEERTVLAWNRSGLAVVVCVAVLLRHVWPLQGTDHEVALGVDRGRGDRVVRDLRRPHALPGEQESAT